MRNIPIMLEYISDRDGDFQNILHSRADELIDKINKTSFEIIRPGRQVSGWDSRLNSPGTYRIDMTGTMDSSILYQLQENVRYGGISSPTHASLVINGNINTYLNPSLPLSLMEWAQNIPPDDLSRQSPEDLKTLFESLQNIVDTHNESFPNIKNENELFTLREQGILVQLKPMILSPTLQNTDDTVKKCKSFDIDIKKSTIDKVNKQIKNIREYYEKTRTLINFFKQKVPVWRSQILSSKIKEGLRTSLQRVRDNQPNKKAKITIT